MPGCSGLYEVYNLSQARIVFPKRIDEAQKEKIENWLRKALATVRIPLQRSIDVAVILATYPNVEIVLCCGDPERIMEVIEAGWQPEDTTVVMNTWGSIDIKLPNGRDIGLITRHKDVKELTKDEHRRFVAIMEKLEKFTELCRELDKLEDEIEKIKSEKNEMETKLRRRIEELERQREALEAENAVLRKRVMELEEKVAKLEGRIQELEEELNQCYDEGAAEETAEETYDEEAENAEVEEAADP